MFCCEAAAPLRNGATVFFSRRLHRKLILLTFAQERKHTIMRTAYIIDFSNWCYRFRAVHVAKQTKYIPGIGPVDFSEYYGFMNALSSIPGDEIFLVVDGTPKRQKELLPSYKGNRDHEAPQAASIPHRQLLALLSQGARKLGRKLHIVGAPFREADEVIAYLVDALLGLIPDAIHRGLVNSELHTPDEDPRIVNLMEGEIMLQGGGHNLYHSPFDEIVIGSADSDLYQLKHRVACGLSEPVTGRVFFDLSTSGKEIQRNDNTPAAVHHLPPYCITTYKALFGDTSDCIPGAVPARFGKGFRTFAEKASYELMSALDYDLRYAQHPCAPRLSFDYKALGFPGIFDHFRTKPEDWRAFLRNLHLVELRGNAASTEFFYSEKMATQAYDTYIA